MGQLSGRHIFISGAASGMGEAIARSFHAEGAQLVLLDRNEAGIRSVADSTGALGIGCDVTDREAVSEAIAQTVDHLGALDGVVNAAGVLTMKPFENLEPSDWDRMLAVNLSGPFNVLRVAVPHLRRAASATVVNISSVSAILPMPGSTGYSASKGGLSMFTKALACDLGPDIRVNAICPGVIKTEMTRYIWENPEHAERAEQRVALKRLGLVEDVAQAALFLTSATSGFTTGAELPVDGGFAWP